MFSIIKDVVIFEDALNANPNPLLFISKENHDILYWNDSYKEFLERYFNITPLDKNNIKDYPEVIQNVFYDIVEKTKKQKIYTYEAELGESYIKTQVVCSKTFFIVFVDVTESRKLLKSYLDKNNKLEEMQKAKKQLLIKNLKLWSILSSRIIQILFGLIVFLGVVTSLIKDYYLGEYEKDRKILITYISQQNDIKSEFIKQMNKNNELTIKSLKQIEQKETEILELIKQLKKEKKI
ncbi:MAG: hypothetical protein NZZ41_01315 [Candidatus Dojkabacteria bacterium]|nr:hypothetical protein [Candidatus Dojkabacteria bacterium]